MVSACVTAPQRPAAAPQAHGTAPAIAIVGATVVDGSGAAPFLSNAVVIRGDRIVAVNARSIPRGATITDGKGLTLAPGFIDMHNHSGSGLERDPSATTQVSQGITTLVLGQDGGSVFPVGDYLRTLEQNPVAVNVLTTRIRTMHGMPRSACSCRAGVMTMRKTWPTRSPRPEARIA
jgi:N-acyl-D-amino-acid deacylase